MLRTINSLTIRKKAAFEIEEDGLQYAGSIEVNTDDGSIKLQMTDVELQKVMEATEALLITIVDNRMKSFE